jgi:UDP-N-acetyl-D-glucosamine dehydrogenase
VKFSPVEIAAPRAHGALADSLVERCTSRTARVGVIGLGYVGLPLALRFAEAGFPVVGFDIDAAKTAAIASGKSYFLHIPDSAVAAARRRGLQATTDVRRVAEVDALLICVPTPLNASREPDLGFVIGSMEAVLPHLRAGQMVSLESTTYPGTTDEELKPRIEKRGFKVGEDIFLCFSPEREDPGNAKFTTRNIPKICGGATPACLKVGVALYSQAVDQVVPVSSTRAAEMTKLLENIHRAVNIGLVNELKTIADRMDIDILEVIRAAATKPFGFVPYQPGPGLGGHCIPIDPFYLTWKARQYGVHTRFIELAGEINNAMPHWVVGKVADALNERRKPLNGSRVLVLGIAYKKNVDDMRESPAVELMSLLAARGAHVEYCDPHVPVFPRMRKYRFDLESVPLDADRLRQYDVVLIATDHDVFDYETIRRHAQLIVDTRGVYRERAPHIVMA